MRSSRLLGLVIVGAIIAGCGGMGSAGSTSSSTPSTSTTPTTIGTPMPPSDDPLNRTIDLAKQDLVARIGIDESSIEILKAEAVTWQNGALGCPEPGNSYTQALVDGYQVILFADGRAYDYHAGSDAVPFLCSSGEKDGGRDFVPPPGHDR